MQGNGGTARTRVFKLPDVESIYRMNGHILPNLQEEAT